MDLYPKMLDLVSEAMAEVKEPYPYTRLSNSVDIIYSDSFPRGGSIGAHADDEMPWGCVIVLSLGQTRYFRVRHTEAKKYINVEMRDNSVIAMIGKNFQRSFTHQVDKLSEKEPVGVRLSLNIRFLEE